MALAADNPTRSDPIRPGPLVTAIPSISGQGHPRILQGLKDHRDDGLDMFAGGDFRDDAAVPRMHIDL